MGKHGRCPECQSVNELTEVPSNKPLTPEALHPLTQSLSPPSIGVSLDLPIDGLQSESPSWTQPPPPALGSEEIKLAPVSPQHTAFPPVPNTFPNVANTPTTSFPAQTPTPTTTGTATLILIRKTRGGQLVRIKVLLDNKPLCKIAYGKTANVMIPSGRHTLLVKGGGAFKGASVPINASPDSVHCYEISYSIVGTINLKPQSPPANVPIQGSAGITAQDVTALAEGVSALFSLFDDD
ncbi:MAG: hypothetical protein HOB20_04205 [Planctomycetaceae bacterium]|nr:hypothetical protein [Planctomycetaceae bacterium]